MYWGSFREFLANMHHCVASWDEESVAGEEVCPLSAPLACFWLDCEAEQYWHMASSLWGDEESQSLPVLFSSLKQVVYQ